MKGLGVVLAPEELSQHSFALRAKGHSILGAMLFINGDVINGDVINGDVIPNGL